MRKRKDNGSRRLENSSARKRRQVEKQCRFSDDEYEENSDSSDSDSDFQISKVQARSQRSKSKLSLPQSIVRVGEVCRERDGPCPFVMLPPELTIYIFEMTILPLAPHMLHHHPDHFHRPHKQLAVFSLVCRCWYHLANDTSLFHSLDTSQYPNITAEQAIQICNRRPLLQSLSLMGMKDSLLDKVLACATKIVGTSLRSLRVEKTDFSSRDLSQIAKSCTGLHTLELKKRGISDGPHIVELVKGCKQLKKLCLRNFNSTTLLDELTLASHLTELTISATHFQNYTAIQLLVDTIWKENLTKLHLLSDSYTPTGTESIEMVITKCRNLSDLALNCRDLVPVVKRLAQKGQQISNLQALQGLLPYQEQARDFYSHIAALFPSLRMLTMEGVAMSTESMALVLKNCRHLEELVVHSPKLAAVRDIELVARYGHNIKKLSFPFWTLALSRSDPARMDIPKRKQIEAKIYPPIDIALLRELFTNTKLVHLELGEVPCSLATESSVSYCGADSSCGNGQEQQQEKNALLLKEKKRSTVDNDNEEISDDIEDCSEDESTGQNWNGFTHHRFLSAGSTKTRATRPNSIIGPEKKVLSVHRVGCPGCGAYEYCSIQCQQRHWDQHKSQCSGPVLSRLFGDMNICHLTTLLLQDVALPLVLISSHRLTKLTLMYSAIRQLQLDCCNLRSLRLVHNKKLHTLTIDTCSQLECATLFYSPKLQDLYVPSPVLLHLAISECTALEELRMDSKQIERLTIESSDIVKLCGSFDLCRLKSFYAHMCNITAMEFLGGGKEFNAPLLKVIDWTNFKIGTNSRYHKHSDAKVVLKCPQLQYLNCPDSFVDDYMLMNSELPHLISANLERTNVTGQAVLSLVEKCPLLKELSIIENYSITMDDIEWIAAHVTMGRSQLRWLKVNQCSQLDSAKVRQLLEEKYPTFKRKISFWGTPLHSVGLDHS